MDYEFADRGYLFRKGRMRITVSEVLKVCYCHASTKYFSLSVNVVAFWGLVLKIQQAGNMESLASLMKVWFVEMSVSAPSGQEQVQDELKSFAEQLKPYPLLQIRQTFEQKPTLRIYNLVL